MPAVRAGCGLPESRRRRLPPDSARPSQHAGGAGKRRGSVALSSRRRL